MKKAQEKEKSKKEVYVFLWLPNDLDTVLCGKQQADDYDCTQINPILQIPELQY